MVYQKIRREEAAKRLKPEARRCIGHRSSRLYSTLDGSRFNDGWKDQRNVYVERSDIWVKKMARKAG